MFRSRDLPRRLPLVAAAACAVMLSVTTASAAHAERSDGPDHPRGATVLALLGDTPYGDGQRAAFPGLVADVNASPRVSMVLHAGDVKSGGTTCDDARFADLRALFDTFDDPFVLTPGDNEWTDCHRVAAGQYVPTERLDAVRDVFFPRGGRTIGGRAMPVTSQAGDPDHSAYRENVRFQRGGVTFATVHVVGSDNDLEPWDELPQGDMPETRLAEFRKRQAAGLDWVDETFDAAEEADSAGVLLMMQAEPVETAGFRRTRERILERARELGKPVLLVHGDEHAYEVERSYGGVPNLTRLETFGATASRWLEVTADPRHDAEVFSWVPRSVS